MKTLLEKVKKIRFVIFFVPVLSLIGFTYVFKLCSSLFNRFFIQPFVFAIDWGNVDQSKCKLINLVY